MRAIIITKSSMNKHGVQGACTTAYDVDSGRLVRFVSDTQGAPIPYRFSVRFDKLDLVEGKVLASCPVGPQTENLLVDPQSIRVIWKQYCGIQELYQKYLQTQPDKRFPSFLARRYHKLDSVSDYRHSLELAYVTGFTLEKTPYDTQKASFRIAGFQYRYFSITDPEYDLRNSNENSRCFGNGWIVASIPTEPWIQNGENKGYFIFIAAFYPDERCDRQR